MPSRMPSMGAYSPLSCPTAHAAMSVSPSRRPIVLTPSAGDLLHRRGWPHAPFPPRSSGGRKQRVLHDDTFAVEQPVQTFPLDISLTPCNTRLHSLHVTYRRLIPAIEVSLRLFVVGVSCINVFPDRNSACRRARPSKARLLHDNEDERSTLFDPLRVRPGQTQSLVNASLHPLVLASLG